MTHEQPNQGLGDTGPNEAGQKRESLTQWWDRSKFYHETAHGIVSCPDVVDVTGLSRFLVYGPYCRLDPGLWRATVLLKLCTDAARRPIGVQFGAEPAYTTIDLPFGVAGDHRIVLEHRLAENEPVQIRLWLKKAAFHGHILFFGAYFERVIERPDVDHPTVDHV